MRRKSFVAALVLAALSLPASAQMADLHAGHTADADPASAAYAEAMERMHDPMMAGIANPDPDIAFVLGMIPHHQGAIDMAEIVLEHGKDPFTRQLAREVIATQQEEISKMRDWLAERGVTPPTLQKP
jgi:uncharacterized protein (DUF305 family)